MKQISLALVILVFYLIQALGDVFQDRGLTLDPETRIVLDKIEDVNVKSQLRARYIEVFNMAHATGHTEGHSVGYATGHSEGHSVGYATGHTEGHSEAEGVTFMSSFECATNGLKSLLEDSYKLGEFLLLHYRKKTTCKGLVLPSDISKVIQDNDEWVRKYNPEKLNKKSTFKAVSVNALDDNDDDALIPIDIEVYKAKVKISFETWYQIINLDTSVYVTAPFIKDLQAALGIFYKTNSANPKYKTINDVKVRFAAHMARSFKMMCALHHSLNTILRSKAQQNKELDFLTILLEYAPTWYMSPEQFQFLNILRQVIPDILTSLNYVDVQNNEDQWVVLPYDHSTDCGRLMFNELPTTPNNLYADAPISIVFDKHLSKPPLK